MARITNQEKESFRYLFDSIKTENDLKNVIYELYINHRFKYRNILTISNYVYGKIDIKRIVDILTEFDVKKCSRGVNCKFLNGYIQSRSNFSTDQTSTDGKSSVCISCYNYDRNFKRADKNKKDHTLKFQKLKKTNQQEKFLVSLYSKGFTYQYLSSISLYNFKDVIKILEKYNIKRCGHPLCPNPVQNRINFSIDKTSTDGLKNYCRTCSLKYNKSYYLENVDELLECGKKYNNKFGKYDTHAPQIEFSETDMIRRDPDNPKLIQVQCKLCKKWFNPTNMQLQSRINCLNGNAGSLGSENNMYCSQECKDKCPLYNARVSQLLDQVRLLHNNHTEEDEKRLQELRPLFLYYRNPTKCESCGKDFDQKDLELHHIIPRAVEPMIEADPDNLVFLCKVCHKIAHQKDGCTLPQLRQHAMENRMCG